MAHSPVYARDLNPDVLNDAFLGRGFEELLKKAKEQNTEVIVGFYLEKPRLERVEP